MNNARETFLVGDESDVMTTLNITDGLFLNGEIGAFRTTGVNVGLAVTNTAANPDFPFFFAQKQTGDLAKGTKKSYQINTPYLVNSVRVAGYRAESPMTKFIGYDGADSTKTLSYDCETDYGIKFIIDSPYVKKYYNSYAGGGLKKTIHITTDCCEDCDAGCGTAICYVETAKFVKKINDNEPESSGIAFSIYNSIYAELMLDNILGDLATALTIETVTLTNGSPTVTFGTTTTIPTGTYLRITRTATPATPPLATDPVYKVLVGGTGVSTITLDTPWQGVTGTRAMTATTATSEIQIVAIAGVTACGIRITGKFVSSTTGCCCFPPFAWDVDGVTFIIANPDLGKLPCSALTITDGAALTMGQGTYRQMQYAEMYAAGYSDIRQWFKDCAFNHYTSYLVSGETYDVVYIEYSMPIDNPHDPLVSQTPIRLTIACPTEDVGVTGWVDVVSVMTVDRSLNPLLGSIIDLTNTIATLNPNFTTTAIQA